MLFWVRRSDVISHKLSKDFVIMAPSKKTNGSSSPKKAPKSAFSGKYTSTPPGLIGKKDNRNLMFVEGLKNGVMIVYFQKSNAVEEAFVQPNIKHLEENPDIMAKLGINAIVFHKGSSGDTEMKQSASSSFNWKQLILIIGEHNNNPGCRKELAKKLLEYFNSHATEEFYTYPRNMKFAKDNTQNPYCPVDACLLDSDVVALMEAAYPDMEIDELSTFGEIMSSFWTDVEHGMEVIGGSS